MLQLLRQCVSLFALLTLLTGVAYPLAVTGAAKLLFPHSAQGSTIERDGKIIGSELIGQPFAGAGNFWGRPSATSPAAYNSLSSSGSNLGPTNETLLKDVAARVAAIRAAHPERDEPPPIDLVTASASGLDPHISVPAARYQAERVALARSLNVREIEALIDNHTEARCLGVWGEPRVNVLRLNLALDERLRKP